MKLVITYKDADDKNHQDHLVSALDAAYLVNEQGEVQPNESLFQEYLLKFYEDIGCHHVEIKEET
jgi:hypothetical protein